MAEYSPTVRSARGRSHEASCGWDRMRRLRACLAKHALGRRRGSARRPLGAARQELADGGRPQVGRPPQSAARLPDGERRDGAPRGARVLERERGTTEQWLRHLARHLPRIWRGTGRRAYPGPRQKTWVMPFGRTCNRFATLREHLSIGGDRPSWRRDSAIPFNHIEARFEAVYASKDAGGPPGNGNRAGRQGPWTPRPV
jgi:hypothetical protein